VGDEAQLDLFSDSRDVMLRNDAITAVMARDAVAAASARDTLAAEDGQHAALPALDTVIATLRALPPARFARHDECQTARLHLEQHVAPAAHDLLGEQAPGWLRHEWRRLAEAARALPFAAAHLEDHAAPLWLRANAPAQAEEAAAGIESWRRIPAPLAWMLQARHATQGLDAVWPLLAELAWLAPERLAASTQAMADPLLKRLLQAFDAQFEPEPGDDALAWFPAWVVNHQQALLPHLRPAQSGQGGKPERAFRLMCELLGLERQGRHAELMAQRKRLKDQHAGLWAAYIGTR
jgi:hypothetical protein